MANLFKKIFSRSAKTPKRLWRNFQAARQTRLEADWILSPLTTNEELRSDLRKLMMRSRDLAKNNSDYIKWLQMRETNIIGDAGIRLMMRVENFDGKTDDTANDLIEQHWDNWGKRRNKLCAYRRRSGWLDILGLVDRTLAIDGECFVRKVYDPDSPYGFRLEVIDTLEIDIDYNIAHYNGNQIVMGVELTLHGEVVAYHRKVVIENHSTKYHRIPVDEIYHLYKVTFPGQLRGFPQGSGAILDINMAQKYRETALAGARVAIAQMGFITSQGDSDEVDLEANTSGNQRDQTIGMEPGMMYRLNPGDGVSFFTPQQPVAAFPPFMKSIGRSISQGLGVSYNNHAEDLDNVSFSSMRAGAIAERDMWKLAQRFLIQNFIEPVFADWLRALLASNLTPLPQSKYYKFLADRWQARRWDWVDPFKDAKANELKLDMQITSRRRICGEIGLDFDDVVAELEQENKQLAQHGLTPVSFNEKLNEKTGADNDKNT
ncbi:MAG: phage portal protein [Lentisphaerae bacterium]|nr:phage portal protein [Lentisphaerota bacterium]